MKKAKYIILSVLSAMALTSCSLFNDKDIVVENHFNEKGQTVEEKEAEAKIGDVESQRLDDVPNTLVFKNIVYSNMEGNKIKNTYVTASPYEFKYNVNGGENYDVDKNNNNFDLYVPDGAVRSQDQNVVLFIHGGAWISGLKTQVNPYVKKFAAEGYIAATIEYTLLNQAMDDDSLSVFRDLDEIDACLYTMKQSLVSLGFTGNLNIVLGGASSGAHLAMLYAYSRDSKRVCPFGNVKFLIDAVGPTDIDEYVWKAFKCANQAEYDAALNAGIEFTAIEDRRSADALQELQVAGQSYYWNEYQTMRIANGMCGLPFSLSEVEAAAKDATLTEVDHSTDVYKSIVCETVLGKLSGQELLSVTTYMTDSNKIPMICAYAGRDAVIGVAHFASLQSMLDGFGTEYEYFYFKNCGHANLDTDETTYNAFIAKILNWMATK